MPVEGVAFRVNSHVVAELEQNPSNVVLPVTPSGIANINIVVVSSLDIIEVEAGRDGCLPVEVMDVGGEVSLVALVSESPVALIFGSVIDGNVSNFVACAVSLEEGNCNNLGNVSIDSYVGSCLVNNASSPSPPTPVISPIISDVNDEEEFFLDYVVGDAGNPSVNLVVSKTFVDIPILVVSNEELNARLTLSVSKSCVDHSNWLNVSDGEVDEIENEFQDTQDMYNFMG
ncbi:hypothetical protein KFK09_018586 [Dendrobium nobile]|uniref:Uncharacterized protein n=1 Tax=Dendrobium nobile TaxID=94219 RepID=A0A8T3AWD0_DENNO|nr:hypothetical protein KFK09_018586 [Dendrobium nobile]